MNCVAAAKPWPSAIAAGDVVSRTPSPDSTDRRWTTDTLFARCMDLCMSYKPPVAAGRLTNRGRACREGINLLPRICNVRNGCCRGTVTIRQSLGEHPAMHRSFLALAAAITVAVLGGCAAPSELKPTVQGDWTVFAESYIRK